jgi:hypothetical protein
MGTALFVQMIGPSPFRLPLPREAVSQFKKMTISSGDFPFEKSFSGKSKSLGKYVQRIFTKYPIIGKALVMRHSLRWERVGERVR